MTAGSDDTIVADVALALAGQGDALERVLRSAEPQVFGLAVRMLGNRDDARDATQEILLRLATHLSEFRGESRFSTWAYRVATNALLDERRARARVRERSFSDIAADLDKGVDAFEQTFGQVDPVTPEDRAATTELALMCTQGMLMALDPRHRLAYLLGEVLELSSDEGATIADITPDAFRQQLARARNDLRAFLAQQCGLVGARATCTCARQFAVLGERTVKVVRSKPLSKGDPMPALHDAVARAGVEDIRSLRSAAQVFRAHPQYGLGDHVAASIRARIAATVFGAR